MFLLLGLACSNTKQKLNNDFDIIDNGQADNGSLPTDNENVTEEDEHTEEEHTEDNEINDDDTEIQERECETVCGKGVEQFIDGEWKNCTAPKDKDKRDCEKMNTYGTCSGFETCTLPEGWDECDALDPEPEYYDGKDNNCNGETDENIINPVTDGTVDEGLEKIDGTDPENPTGEDGLTLSRQSKVLPYLWAANHTAQSVSKFNTETNIDEAKYWVGVNPSRTAVDLDGNMWVGGRDDGRLTKVLWDTTKCPESNGILGIQTSHIDGNNGRCCPR